MSTQMGWDYVAFVLEETRSESVKSFMALTLSEEPVRGSVLAGRQGVSP